MTAREFKRPLYRLVHHDWYGEWPLLVGFEKAEIPAATPSLDFLRGLPRVAPRSTGLYFLWRYPQLIYVGFTANDIDDRTSVHYFAKKGRRTGTRYPFSWFTCWLGEAFAMKQMETELIAAYLPPLNKMRNAGWGRRTTSIHTHAHISADDGKP